MILNHPPAENQSFDFLDVVVLQWFQIFPDVHPLSLLDDAVSKEAGKGSLNMMYSLSLLKSAFGFNKKFPTDLIDCKKRDVGHKTTCTCFRFWDLTTRPFLDGLDGKLLRTKKQPAPSTSNVKIPSVCGWKRDMLCWNVLNLRGTCPCFTMLTWTWVIKPRPTSFLKCGLVGDPSQNCPDEMWKFIQTSNLPSLKHVPFGKCFAWIFHQLQAEAVMVPYYKWIWCIVLCKRRPSSMCWKGLCLAWTSLRIDWITRSRLNGWSAVCQPRQLVWIFELSLSLGNDMFCHYKTLTLVLCLCSPWCLCQWPAQLGVAYRISSLIN